MVGTRMLVVSALLALTVVAGAGPQKNTGKAHRSALRGADLHFVMGAAKGGVAEVEFGKLAAERGANEKVKDFGNRMVKDHSQANTELEKLATDKGLSVPTALAGSEKSMYQKLSALRGAAFDSSYMKMMVKDHTKDVADFERESRTGKDADVKAFASKMLPTLKEHLELARSIAAEVSGGRAHRTTTQRKNAKRY